VGALPDYVEQDLAAAPTTLREPGRYNCRCIFLYSVTGAGLWSAIDGAGTVWIAREEGVPVVVGTEAYISITSTGRPLLWLFPKRDDWHHAIHPVDEGFDDFVPRQPLYSQPPF
jgi:hypothetical protein